MDPGQCLASGANDHAAWAAAATVWGLMEGHTRGRGVPVDLLLATTDPPTPQEAAAIVRAATPRQDMAAVALAVRGPAGSEAAPRREVPGRSGEGSGADPRAVRLTPSLPGNGPGIAGRGGRAARRQRSIEVDQLLRATVPEPVPHTGDLTDTAWQDRAACVGPDPEAFFANHAGVEARAACLSCLVRAECLGFALAFPRSHIGGSGAPGPTAAAGHVHDPEPRGA